MKLNAIPLWLIWLSSTAVAQDGIQLMDKGIFYMLDVEELEVSDVSDRNDLAWDADLWAGTDINRLWIKTKGEEAVGGDDHSELQVLYSRAIAPFWNLQAGIRREFDPRPDENWAVFGVQGLARYGLELEAELFLADGGRTSARLRSDYDLLLTQRLILTPEAEVVAYGRTDRRREIGSGLSRVELGIRLRYEIRREFAPYVGLRWSRLLGATADFSALRGHDADDLEVVAGVRFWY